MSHSAVFLDKDGTLIDNVPYNVDPGRITLSQGAGEGVSQLSQAGFLPVVVSNQSGVARGLFTEKDLVGVEYRLRELLHTQGGADLAGFYYCPHHPAGTIKEYAMSCGCRKPQPGMIYRAARELDIDLRQSWLIGDILDDIEAGRRAGLQTILINNGNETEWIVSSIYRQPHFIVSDLEQAARTILSIAIANQVGLDHLLVE